MSKSTLKRLKHWYEEHEKRISVASLVGGFIVDSVSLRRIDNPWDIAWIAFNLLVSGLCIILLNRESKAEEGFWLPNILQFSIGALFGSNFIFYLRSSTLSATWPFIAILFIALISNEFFQKRYSKLAFRLSFYYFALFSYLIFLVPILVNRFGSAVFLLSGLTSLLVIWLYLKIFSKLSRERFLEEKTRIWLIVTLIFIGINALYFGNLIPPIPLSLQDGAIYYQIEKTPAGDYRFVGEPKRWNDFLTLWPAVYWQPGEALNAYTAIFAPGSISLDIFHDWQYRNEAGEWITTTKIPLHLAGGRAEGFRTYSTKYNFTPGYWRVDIETARGQIIGRLNFKVVLK